MQRVIEFFPPCLSCRNTLIPELQATAKPPSIVTMKKAIWMLYGQLTLTYLPSAFIGYAAYGKLLLPYHLVTPSLP